MTNFLTRRRLALLAGVIVLAVVWYAWALFFTSGSLQFVLVMEWGETGTGPGQLDAPIGLAIGALP